MRLAVLWVLVAWPLVAQTAEVRYWTDHWAEAYSLPRELVFAVIEVESGWNPRAVSSAGAAGLMQLMPDTAAALGVRNRFDIRENIRGGAAYLAWLRARLGADWRLVVAAYNAGHAHIARRGLNYNSPQVQSYVERVAHVYRRNRWEKLLQLQTRGAK